MSGYSYSNSAPSSTNGYLWPAVWNVLDRLSSKSRRVFEVGCGNGSFAHALMQRGYDVTGVDPSTEGIAQADRLVPRLNLHLGSAYDDLAASYGQFPIVISLEVVEHVFFPRRYARTVFELLEPGGVAILSTPFHGYFKNIALAVTGQMDAHFTALWDHGHIKFWSIKTLSQLLSEAGFRDLEFSRVGRIAPIAKSMVVVARRPA